MSAFHIVILSARAQNLDGCVRSVLAHEPGMSADRIIVVDDGAREGVVAKFPPVTWIPGVKPFVFSRNANIGIRAAGGDVVLMNDDARLKTLSGFTRFSEAMTTRPDVGVSSAAIAGFIGNPRQAPQPGGQLRAEHTVVAFVCVYIPRRTYDQVGPLDERFIGYGADDMDYCQRTLAKGLGLGIFDGCTVSHGEVPSTYRTRSDINQLSAVNLKLYQEKVRGETPKT